jgi:hypothetical protein
VAASPASPAAACAGAAATCAARTHGLQHQRVHASSGHVLHSALVTHSVAWPQPAGRHCSSTLCRSSAAAGASAGDGRRSIAVTTWLYAGFIQILQAGSIACATRWGGVGWGGVGFPQGVAGAGGGGQQVCSKGCGGVWWWAPQVAAEGVDEVVATGCSKGWGSVPSRAYTPHGQPSAVTSPRSSRP